MGIVLLLLLVTPSTAGFSEQDAINQKKTAQEAATAADSELPPCEGHDHFDDVIRRFSPSGSCPKAKEFFDYTLQMSRQIRDNCRETSRWVEDRLRNTSYCSSDSGMQSALKHLSELKRKISEEEEPENITKLLDDPALNLDEFEEAKAAPGSGEWALLECRQAINIALQFRMRQRQLAKKHFAMADEALSAVCEDPKGADDYFDFLRKGEDGL